MVCHCRYHDSVLHIKLGWETDRFSFCSFPKCPSNHKITILRFKLARFRLALRAQMTRNLFFFRYAKIRISVPVIKIIYLIKLLIWMHTTETSEFTLNNQ